MLSNLLEIPASALTPKGNVWFVDAKNKLRRFQAEALFSKDQNIYVNVPASVEQTSPFSTASFSIVVSPLSSYLPGLEVKPKRLIRDGATLKNESTSLENSLEASIEASLKTTPEDLNKVTRQ